MKYLWLVPLVAFFAPPAAAQPPRPDRTAMYEDVEVMRRLLGDAIAHARPFPVSANYLFSTGQYIDPLRVNLQRYGATVNTTNLARYGAVAMDWGTPYTHGGANTLVNPYAFDDVALSSTYRPFLTVHSADRPAPPTDGTYVKGVGVLFTVDMDLSDAAALEPPSKSASLVATCNRCHGTAMDSKVQPPRAAAKSEPTDAWDAKLRQVRGEKEPQPKEPPATRLAREEICVPGHLTELVLNHLSKYGHRFRELPANEAITVVVTLKGPPPSEKAASEPGGQAVAQAEEQLALADLHAKQGKTDEAFRAYQKVVEILSKPLQFSESTAYDQVRAVIENANKTLRNAHGKLAQALLEQSKLDEAKAAIEKAKTVTVRVEGEGGKKPVAPKVQLPIKLTVRVPKQMLDDHKAGRMTIDQLRAAAEVEAVGFPRSAPTKASN
jgi:cytochrome c553